MFTSICIYMNLHIHIYKHIHTYICCILFIVYVCNVSICFCCNFRIFDNLCIVKVLFSRLLNSSLNFYCPNPKIIHIIINISYISINKAVIFALFNRNFYKSSIFLYASFHILIAASAAAISSGL